MHIYRHKANGGDMTLPVTHLLKNATKFIYLDTSFFKVFFTIKELPYIAVLDSENHFYGILTHSTLLNMLSQSWSVEQGSYVLTIASTGKQGDLAAIAKIISKHSSIASCITLDIEKDEYIRRTLITLPANTEAKVCETIVNHLEKKNYKVVEIENLQTKKHNQKAKKRKQLICFLFSLFIIRHAFQNQARDLNNTSMVLKQP